MMTMTIKGLNMFMVQ